MIITRRYALYFCAAVLLILVVNHYRNSDNSAGSPRTKAGWRISRDPHFSWSKVPIQYPVKALTPIPTAAPQKLPLVQYNFLEETPSHKDIRVKRQAAVRTAFERCWRSYRKHAFGHDELAPLSGGTKNDFGGWAANLVDNLDTLWIMGFKSEFEEAVQAAMRIDLSRTTLVSINVFETTIRHLGGLLSAYDLSGDERLLRKAKEFGEMLLVPFDTPNHLPITRWNPQAALKKNQLADEVVLLAEIGSLSLEFTRLSLITGDARWYDAVERITRMFANQQEQTILKGMWPVTVNAREGNFTADTFFTLSAMADSHYEYFPKMHALLGGVEPVYRHLYDRSMGAAIAHNLFRPMVPDNADILVSAGVRALPDGSRHLDAQGQHLVCFAGGMFALGSKLFAQPIHMDVAKKLTNGCLWTYKHMPRGIMPEVFNMLPCASTETCTWNETAWKAAVQERHGGDASAEKLIREGRLPRGFTYLRDRRYVLRPEAIESVFMMYRITGRTAWEEAAWEMFTAITNATETPLGNAVLMDVTYSAEELQAKGVTVQSDNMESFWMAETLKYFYLIFSDPQTISLDEWVFNTEAHPFKRRLPA